jgi:hypothetical protein|tara:strand:- start:40 stop:555 length:516 start_codon:yes stop_codon:yes gene_type:complete
MQNNNYNIEQYEEERKILNNELVCPAYRKFCRDNGLNFHFWDELPKEDFNPEISQKELKLHEEAMNLFNRLKPEYDFFNGKVVHFHFTTTSGDFDFDTWEIEDFLKEISEDLRYFRPPEKFYANKRFSNSLLKFCNTTAIPIPVSQEKRKIEEDKKLKKRIEVLRKALSSV